MKSLRLRLKCLTALLILSVSATYSSAQQSLDNDTVLSSLSGSKKSRQWYKIQVPKDQTKLIIEAWGGTGDPDIYVMFGSEPSTKDYDAKSTKSSTSESITIRNPNKGAMYILVYGYKAYSGLYLRAKYSGGSSDDRVATPQFQPGSGCYLNPVEVTLTCSTKGATIRYTKDGKTPTASSPEYKKPIKVTTDTTIKAKAFKKGLDDARTAEANFDINSPGNIYVGIDGASEYAQVIDNSGYDAYAYADDEIEVFLRASGLDVSNPSSIATIKAIAASTHGGQAAMAYYMANQPNSRAVIIGAGNSNIAKSEIDSFCNNNSNYRVILSGFSAGGGDLQNLLNKLKKLGIQVRYSAHIDSIEYGLGGDGKIPNNTAFAHNFFQKDGRIRGESKLVAASKSTTLIINTRIDKPSGPAKPAQDSNAYHRNMDNDERVILKIFDDIRTALRD